MRVLLVGKGAREHALARKLAASPLLTKLYIWPGHGGMADLGERLVLAADASHAALGAEAKRLNIDVVVCGPEGPLSEGLADYFETLNIPTFGPHQAAAALESSKSFAKDVMQAAGIPTARYVVVSDEASCRREAERQLRETGGTVLKASGLAAGKGVFVCFDRDAIEAGLKHLYHTDMIQAATSVVVEEVLRGRECSYFTFIGTDGPTELGFAVDYKRLQDDDIGPNTGGMGCYAPVPWLPRDAGATIERLVVKPLLAELEHRDIHYRGCLYVGIMWHQEKGPSVVEFNVRLGDPEAQVLSAYDDRDWLALIAAKCGLKVPADALKNSIAPITHGEAAVAIVMASADYPYGIVDAKDADKLKPATLPVDIFNALAAANTSSRVQVYGAAIKGQVAPFQTATGRVLTVTGRGKNFAAARQAAYAVVERLAREWPGSQWRRDIAGRAADETL